MKNKYFKQIEDLQQKGILIIPTREDEIHVETFCEIIKGKRSEKLFEMFLKLLEDKNVLLEALLNKKEWENGANFISYIILKKLLYIRIKNVFFRCSFDESLIVQIDNEKISFRFWSNLGMVGLTTSMK